MTTKVTVEANHGWPVDVEFIPVNGGSKAGCSPDTRVPAGEKHDFYITSSQDIRVHEVQPSELAATDTDSA